MTSSIWSPNPVPFPNVPEPIFSQINGFPTKADFSSALASLGNGNYKVESDESVKDSLNVSLPTIYNVLNGVATLDVQELYQYVRGRPSVGWQANVAAAGLYKNKDTVARVSGLGAWQNTVDGNTINPDTVGTNWIDATVSPVLDIIQFLSPAQLADVRARTLLLDCTAALQAAFDYCSANSLTLLLHNYRYRISAPLTLGQNSAVVTQLGSFVISGDSRYIGIGKACQIVLFGTGHEAIIQFNYSARRAAKIQGVALTCNTAPAADVYASAHGIKFNGTAFTGHQLFDMTITGCRKAIGIYTALSSANGEFMNVYRVSGEYCQTFWYMAAGTGQAFGHHVVDCGWLPVLTQGSLEYVAFDIGDGNGGYGLYVSGFNATCVGPAATGTYPTLTLPPIILYRDRGANGPITFERFRIEGLTSILDNQHASSGALVTFSNIDFAKVYSSRNNPLIRGGSTARCTYVLRECYIPVGVYGFVLSVDYLDNTKYIFERCGIPTYDTSGLTFYSRIGKNVNAEARFYDCWVVRTPGGIKDALNRTHKVENESRALSSITPSHGIMVGTPVNLLQYDNFNAAAPPAPWIVTNGPLVNYTGVDATQVGQFSSNPFSRSFLVPAGFTAVQSFKTITAVQQFVKYMADILVDTGNTQNILEITIENTAGPEFDTIVLSNSLSATGPWSTARVELQLRSSTNNGEFRLRWSAPITNTASIRVYLGSQLCSDEIQATYLPTVGATKKYKHPWTAALELMVIGRFKAPIRTAAFGSNYPAGLPDPEGDLAIEDGRLTWYTGTEFASIRKSIKGTTAQRPALTAIDIGYVDLDTTLDADGKPIFWTGTAWVDAAGNSPPI